jgi:hypothetical protein
MVERRTLGSLIYSVNARLGTFVSPSLEMESTGSRGVWEFRITRGVDAHTLSRALWQIFGWLATALLVRSGLGSNNKGQDLVIDLFCMNCQKLLQGEQAVHLYCFEITVLLFRIATR